MALSDWSVPILYEDNHILVVVKPPNMLSQEDESGDPDMLSWLKDDLKRRHQKPGNVFLGLVHRLDRPVGGVMVFAKTSKAASRLSDQVRRRTLHKTYHAVVHGTPAEQGRLRDLLAKDAKTNTVRTVDPGHPEGKEAILDFRVLDRRGTHSLVEVDLLTGRPHQIRVQFAASGHPLYGDQKYGTAFAKPGEQIALWAVRLGFEHPTQREPMEFHSEPPRTEPWVLFSP